MTFKGSPLCLFRDYPHRRRLDRLHIVAESHRIRAPYPRLRGYLGLAFAVNFLKNRRCGFSRKARQAHTLGHRGSVIETYHSAVIYNRRVEADEFVKRRAVAVFHIAEIFVFSVRSIADRNADRAVIAAASLFSGKAVVEIIFSVVAADNIGCIHIRSFVCVKCILFGAIIYAIAAPVTQIVYRRGKEFIVKLTKSIAAFSVVASEQIYPAVKNVRLAVGNIFVERQDRIISIFLHTLFTPQVSCIT